MGASREYEWGDFDSELMANKRRATKNIEAKSRERGELAAYFVLIVR